MTSNQLVANAIQSQLDIRCEYISRTLIVRIEMRHTLDDHYIDMGRLFESTILLS